MKFRFRHRRLNTITFELCLGNIVWKCTNGAGNYKTHYSVDIHNYSRLGFSNPEVQITPSISYLPWHKSVLASDYNLGTLYYASTLKLVILGF